MNTRLKLQETYNRLLFCYGPQNWWPADDSFEVIIGAILTQSTAWGNVEKAISNLKSANILNPISISQIPINDLAGLIRSSGYYNSKARKLKAFVDQLIECHDCSLEKMFHKDLRELRSELLAIYGIGEETADSIILYAAHKPIFVIDAYTHRITERLGLNTNTRSYSSLQAVFMDNLPHNEQLFNEYHALLVQHGKSACKKSPQCTKCCIRALCASHH